MEPTSRYFIEGTESLAELVAVSASYSTLCLSSAALRRVMLRYLDAELSEDELQLIAEFLEMDESVLPVVNEEQSVNEIVFQIANPDINGRNSAEKINALLRDCIG